VLPLELQMQRRVLLVVVMMVVLHLLLVPLRRATVAAWRARCRVGFISSSMMKHTRWEGSIRMIHCSRYFCLMMRTPLQVRHLQQARPLTPPQSLPLPPRRFVRN
jgi:hypothetical protein